MGTNMKRGALAALALLLLTAGVLAGVRAATRAEAGTFTVTKTADTNDGTCDADCSLREAVGAANAAAGADIITLPAGTYTLTISGNDDANANGDLDVTQNLTINGVGSATTIIDGGALDDVIDVQGLAGLTIGGATVRNGSGSGIEAVEGPITLTDVVVSGNAGIGINFAGDGDVTMTNSSVSNNGGIGLDGFDGTVSMTDSSVSNNGGIGIDFFDGSVDMTDSSVSNNGGAGIDVFGATVTLTGSSVSNNDGAGISTSDGLVVLKESTISDNFRAGIDTTSGDVALDSSTISGNEEDGISVSDAAITAVNSTISNNTDNNITTSGETTTITLTNVTVSDSQFGRGISSPSGTVTLRNTIIANNDTGDCNLGAAPGSSEDLDSDGTCLLAGVGDLSNTDPLLGALADNGGGTKTQALLTGSPAIDAGTNAGCPPTDQRGVARPVNGTCDMGAFEANGATPPTSTPDATGTPDATNTPKATNTPCTGSCPVRNTPTRTSTPVPTKTAVPAPAVTQPAVQPAGSPDAGGAAGVIRLPDTGTGGDAGGAGWPWWALLASVAGGAALVGAGLRRRRV